MPSIGPLELIIILVLVVIIFGVGKLPDLGSALGKGLREFRKTTRELDEIKSELDVTKDLKESLNMGDPVKPESSRKTQKS